MLRRIRIARVSIRLPRKDEDTSVLLGLTHSRARRSLTAVPVDHASATLLRPSLRLIHPNPNLPLRFVSRDVFESTLHAVTDP